MWLATKYGFFSVVKDTKSKAPRWLVRARKAQDLVSIACAARLPESESKVIHTPDADYCARLRVSGVGLASIMELLSRTVDYHNFKSMIHFRPDQKDKSFCYAECWQAMRAYQERTKVRQGWFLCSPERPMPKGSHGHWEHTGAHEVGDQLDGWPGGDIVRMRCDNCGHEWTKELPQ